MADNQTTELTRADRSDAAATAGREERSSITVLEFETPAGKTPLGLVGDYLQLLSGGTYYIDPIEDPTDAYSTYKLSPHLSPVLSAINANVYAANAIFEPVIDLSREESAVVIEDALAFEAALRTGGLEADPAIGEETVAAVKRALGRRQRNEMQYLEQWFGRCCPGSTYRVLRQLVGLDMEISGTGYMEVVRDTGGRPAYLIWAPSWSIRALPPCETLVPVYEPMQVSKLSWGREWHLRRFRSYVQVDTNAQAVGRFKEFGDPRVMSRVTGKYYSHIGEMQSADDEFTSGPDGEQIPSQPATELLTFRLETPINTAYGKPDWTGVYPNLIGGREVEEENRGLLTDQKVPQMFILAAGAAGIATEDIKDLREQIKQNRAAGRKGIYIIQAKSARMANGQLSATPTLEIVKTKSEQYQDALGLKYQEHSAKLVRLAYRMPRAELGDDEGTTKDQQLFAHRFAESQVYDPRRALIDDRMNTTVLVDLGIQTVRQRTRPRPPKEPTELATIVSLLTRAGVLTPDDGRELARDIFDRDFRDLLGVWSKLPKELLTALLQTKNQLVAAALLASEETGDILDRLREALEQQMGSTEPTRPGQVPVPRGGEILGNERPDQRRPEPPARDDEPR